MNLNMIGTRRKLTVSTPTKPLIVEAGKSFEPIPSASAWFWSGLNGYLNAGPNKVFGARKGLWVQPFGSVNEKLAKKNVQVIQAVTC